MACAADTVKQELAAGKAELDDAKEEHLRAKTEAGRIDSLLQSNTEERERLNKRMRDLIAEAKEIRAGGAEVKGLVEAVDGAPGAASFDDLITGLEKKKEKKQTTAAFAGSMKQVVDLFEQHQAKDHNCPLCARDISPGSNELKIFQEKLSEFLQDIDSADAKRKIEGFDKQIVALREARDKKDHAGKVQAQAQELAGQEDDMKQERERAARQLEDAADKQTRAQERYDKTEHVSDFLRQLDLANLNRLRQKIAQAEAELSSRDPNEVWPCLCLGRLHASLRFAPAAAARTLATAELRPQLALWPRACRGHAASHATQPLARDEAWRVSARRRRCGLRGAGRLISHGIGSATFWTLSKSTMMPISR